MHQPSSNNFNSKKRVGWREDLAGKQACGKWKAEVAGHEKLARAGRLAVLVLDEWGLMLNERAEC